MRDNFLQKLIHKKQGSVLIGLVAAILLLGAIALIMSSLMSGSQQSISRGLDSARAFSLVQGGVEYTGKYLKGITDWSTLSGTFTKSLGTTGSFTITWGAYDSVNKNLTVTISASSGSGNRQVITTFHKSGGTMAAISSEKDIVFNSSSKVDCNGEPTPCTQTYVSPSNLPVVSVPAGPPPAPPGGCSISGGGDHHFPGGTYYCSAVTWKQAMNIVADGPVTLFCGSLTMQDSSTFNATGSASNFLIIVSGSADIAGSNQSRGAIYAPGVAVNISQSRQILGAVAGGTSSVGITLDNSSQVIYDKTAGSNCPYYNQTGLGGGGQTSLTNWQE